jgi:hypothetical protein
MGTVTSTYLVLNTTKKEKYSFKGSRNAIFRDGIHDITQATICNSVPSWTTTDYIVVIELYGSNGTTSKIIYPESENRHVGYIMIDVNTKPYKITDFSIDSNGNREKYKVSEFTDAALLSF